MAACSFYDRDAPIYTMSRFLPPSKVQDSEVSHRGTMQAHPCSQPQSLFMTGVSCTLSSCSTHPWCSLTMPPCMFHRPMSTCILQGDSIWYAGCNFMPCVV